MLSTNWNRFLKCRSHRRRRWYGYHSQHMRSDQLSPRNSRTWTHTNSTIDMIDACTKVANLLRFDLRSFHCSRLDDRAKFYRLFSASLFMFVFLLLFRFFFYQLKHINFRPIFTEVKQTAMTTTTTRNKKTLTQSKIVFCFVCCLISRLRQSLVSHIFCVYNLFAARVAINRIDYFSVFGRRGRCYGNRLVGFLFSEWTKKKKINSEI